MDNGNCLTGNSEYESRVPARFLSCDETVPECNMFKMGSQGNRRAAKHMWWDPASAAAEKRTTSETSLRRRRTITHLRMPTDSQQGPATKTFCQVNYNDNLDKMMIHALYSIAPMHRCVATTGLHCTHQTLHVECPVYANTACLKWTQIYWAIHIYEPNMKGCNLTLQNMRVASLYRITSSNLTYTVTTFPPHRKTHTCQSSSHTSHSDITTSVNPEIHCGSVVSCSTFVHPAHCRQPIQQQNRNKKHNSQITASSLNTW